MPIIYIAGPFTDPDPVFGVAANVASAARAARECMQKGWIFFCPHTHTQGSSTTPNSPRNNGMRSISNTSSTVTPFS